jgi:hypothetical protein
MTIDPDGSIKITFFSAKVAARANQADYGTRGESRPVFKAAYTAQLADFVPDPEQGGQP